MKPTEYVFFTTGVRTPHTLSETKHKHILAPLKNETDMSALCNFFWSQCSLTKHTNLRVLLTKQTCTISYCTLVVLTNRRCYHRCSVAGALRRKHTYSCLHSVGKRFKTKPHMYILNYLSDSVGKHFKNEDYMQLSFRWCWQTL